jgi:hypothetical protein
MMAFVDHIMLLQILQKCIIVVFSLLIMVIDVLCHSLFAVKELVVIIRLFVARPMMLIVR